jgi:hypothetical protein
MLLPLLFTFKKKKKRNEMHFQTEKELTLFFLKAYQDHSADYFHQNPAIQQKIRSKKEMQHAPC